MKLNCFLFYFLFFAKSGSLFLFFGECFLFGECHPRGSYSFFLLSYICYFISSLVNASRIAEIAIRVGPKHNFILVN